MYDMQLYLINPDSYVEKIQVTPGSDNVFADIGHQNPEEALIKAKIAARICEIIYQSA